MRTIRIEYVNCPPGLQTAQTLYYCDRVPLRPSIVNINRDIIRLGQNTCRCPWVLQFRSELIINQSL